MTMNSDTRLQVATYLLGQLVIADGMKGACKVNQQGSANLVCMAVTLADALEQELHGDHEPVDIYKHVRRREQKALESLEEPT